MTQKELSLVLVVLGFVEVSTQWRVGYGNCTNYKNGENVITFSENSLSTPSRYTQFSIGRTKYLITVECSTVAAKLAALVAQKQ